jgi:5-methylcytosine-specific restriction enzyme subunit McrC
MVRGRIRFGEQLARSGSFPLPVDVAYDEYTADILENRLLTTAATLLLRLPRVPALSRQRLAHTRTLLDGVSLIDRPREAVAPPITRLNERYRPSLRLAELILRASSISTQRGAITATAFVFDMNAVFEDFVTAALRDELQHHGGNVKAKWSSTLDYEGGLRIEPDITWWLGDHCVAVLDAKYKSLVTGGVRNPDAYQMLAYCTALQLRSGYLIYATDAGEAERTHTVRHVDREIHVRTVDLRTPPEALLRQIQALAAELTRLGAPNLAA